MPIQTFPVTFVGAGPGDPDLMTVKGQRALMEADVVIYTGSLVPEAMLKWTDADAQVLNSAGMHLEEIVQKMIAPQRAGKRVVRLHTGDPSLYGAIGEQMAALDRAAVPYRIIPGVTAAFAAAAALGIEYTLPEVSQTLILTRMAGRTPVPEAEALSALASHRASMAIYLSIGMIDQVAAALKPHYGEEGACAVVYRVSQPEERIIRTTLDQLPRAVQEAGITRQAVVIVGKVLAAAQADLMHVSKLYDKDFSHGFRG